MNSRARLEAYSYADWVRQLPDLCHRFCVILCCRVLCVAYASYPFVVPYVTLTLALDLVLVVLIPRNLPRKLSLR